MNKITKTTRTTKTTIIKTTAMMATLGLSAIVGAFALAALLAVEEAEATNYKTARSNKHPNAVDPLCDGVGNAAENILRHLGDDNGGCGDDGEVEPEEDGGSAGDTDIGISDDGIE